MKTTIGNYIDDIKNSGEALLSKDEEQELFNTAPLDVAQQKLVTSNLRYVMKMAKKYTNKGLPLEDLVGEGNLGLITAARKFDPAKNVKFITYATWWIRLALQRAIGNNITIRIPQNQINDLVKVKKFLGQGCEFEEAFCKAGFDPADEKTKARIWSQIYQTPLSLDHTYDPDNEFALSNRIMDDRIDIEDSVACADDASDLEKALCKIDGRQAAILRDRHGMNSENKEYTLEELAARYGVSKQRISQLEKKGLAAIKAILDNN